MWNTNTLVAWCEELTHWKRLMLGKEKGVAEDDMVGWHYWLNGHEFVHTPGDSEGQGSPVCFSPWGCRVGRDLATEQQLLFWILLYLSFFILPFNSISRTIISTLQNNEYADDFQKSSLAQISFLSSKLILPGKHLHWILHQNNHITAEFIIFTPKLPRMFPFNDTINSTS